MTPIEHASRIASVLARSAVWSNGECTWIGPLSGGNGSRSLRSASLGPDVYAGTAGIAWFFAALYEITQQSDARRLSVGALLHALRSALTVPQSTRASFYTGITGIAFVSIAIARATGDGSLHSGGVAVLDSLLRTEAGDGNVDLVTGAASSLPVLIVLSRWLKRPELLDRAITIGDNIVRKAQQSDHGISWPGRKRSRAPNLTGLSHGASGIASCLLELYTATGQSSYREVAERAFAYERAWFDEALGNWADFRFVSSTKSRVLSHATQWCHGAPGIALSRIRAWELLRNEQYLAEAHTAIRTTHAAVVDALTDDSSGFCLCHGLAGNAEVLLDSVRAQENDDESLIARSAAESARRALRYHAGSPSFFAGLAGVGYLQLRLYDRRLPSLLLLRPEAFD